VVSQNCQYLSLSLESGRGLPHSKTLRVFGRRGGRASVLECACHLGLWLRVLGLASLLAATLAAHAQPRAYIGFVYPAGGQQGTTVQVKVGGQNLDGAIEVLVSGTGATGRVRPRVLGESGR
jgi:hypothetical protein